MELDVAIPGWTNGTNILELDVPPELERTIASGIRWFDHVVGGEGLTPSTSAMVTGDAGTGKTTMLLQLADAYMSRGHHVIFNTNEENLYQVRKVTRRLRFRSGFHACQFNLAGELIAYARSLQKKYENKKAKDGNPVQVIVVQDSLQTLDDGKYSGGTTSRTPYHCIRMLTEWCKDSFGISIVIGQVDKAGNMLGPNKLKHAIDMHVHLGYDLCKKSETFGERFLYVRKNRFGSTGAEVHMAMSSQGLCAADELPYMS